MRHCSALFAGGGRLALAIEYGRAGYETEGYDEAHAWEISSAATLVKVRDHVNEGNSIIKSGYFFKFTNDIDLTGTAYENWESINITTAQDLTFDGGNHTIKVRMIRRNTYAGLFGNIEKGTIKNLSVSGSIRNNTSTSLSDYIPTDLGTGGIAGRLRAGTIDNCTFDGSIIAHDDRWGNVAAGGIVGRAGDGVVKITNCKVGANSDTTISASHYAGGIIGYFYDKENSNRITGNYSRVTLEDAEHKGLTYGERDGTSGTVSGNTEVDPNASTGGESNGEATGGGGTSDTDSHESNSGTDTPGGGGTTTTSPLNITGTLIDGLVGIPYGDSTSGTSKDIYVMATGGKAPYYWRTEGNFPPESEIKGYISGASSEYVVLKGTPKKSATYDFTIFVKDANNTEKSKNFSITINEQTEENIAQYNDIVNTYTENKAVNVDAGGDSPTIVNVYKGGTNVNIEGDDTNLETNTDRNKDLSLSSGGSGGCEAGLGFIGFAVLAVMLAKRPN